MEVLPLDWLSALSKGHLTVRSGLVVKKHCPGWISQVCAAIALLATAYMAAWQLAKCYDTMQMADGGCTMPGSAGKEGAPVVWGWQ